MPVRYERLFQELTFPERYDPATRKWEKHGMPAIAPDMEDCVFFLYEEADTKMTTPVATGFFVNISGRPHGLNLSTHTYAVTNMHAAPAGASVIRANLGDGRTLPIRLGPDQWEFIAGGHDIAAADVTEQVEPFDHIKTLDVSVFATEHFLAEALVNIGEDGFMLGLFADQPGQKHNAPVGRFGSIAAMASDAHKIEQPNGYSHPSFIFDMRSRGGFSGSPVFIYRMGVFDMQNLIRHRGKAQRERRNLNPFVVLLGIHCGQYPELVKVKEFKKKRGHAEKLEEGTYLQIPGGMTIVAPAWEILKLLDLKKFAEKRKERDLERFNRPLNALPESVATEENAPVPSALGHDPSNPTHKEDFTSLLTAAVTKQSPSGRT